MEGGTELCVRSSAGGQVILLQSRLSQCRRLTDFRGRGSGDQGIQGAVKAKCAECTGPRRDEAGRQAGQPGNQAPREADLNQAVDGNSSCALTDLFI